MVTRMWTITHGCIPLRIINIFLSLGLAPLFIPLVFLFFLLRGIIQYIKKIFYSYYPSIVSLKRDTRIHRWLEKIPTLYFFFFFLHARIIEKTKLVRV